MLPLGPLPSVTVSSPPLKAEPPSPTTTRQQLASSSLLFRPSTRRRPSISFSQSRTRLSARSARSRHDPPPRSNRPPSKSELETELRSYVESRRLFPADLANFFSLSSRLASLITHLASRTGDNKNAEQPSGAASGDPPPSSASSGTADSSLLSLLQHAREHLLSSTSRLRKLSRTHQTLRVGLERLDQEIAVLRRQLDEERASLGREKRNEKRLRGLVREETADLETWVEETEKPVSRQVEQADKELALVRFNQQRCESESIEVGEVCRGLELEVRAMGQQLRHGEMLLQDTNDQARLIEHVPKQLKDQWESLKARIERTERESEAAREQLSRYRTTEEQIRAQIVAAKSTEQMLVVRQDDFHTLGLNKERSIKTKKATIDSIRMQKDVLYDEIGRLERNVIEERAGFSQFLEAKKALVSQKNEYQLEIDGVKKRISFIEDDLQMYEGRRKKAEEMRGELAVAFMNAKKVLDTIDDQVVVLLENYLQEDHSLRQTLEELRHRKCEVATLDDRIGALIAEDKEVTSEFKRLSRQRDMIDRQVLEQQSLFMTRMALAQSIENENKELVREVRAAKQVCCSVRKELSVVRQSRGRYGRMMQENLHFLRCCDQKKDMLVTEVKIMRRKEAAKESDLLKVRSEADTTHKRVEKFQKKTGGLDTQLETLVDDLEDVKAHMSKIQSEIDQLERDIVKVRAEKAHHLQGKAAANAEYVQQESVLVALIAKERELMRQVEESENALQVCKEEHRRSVIAVKQLRVSAACNARRSESRRCLESQVTKMGSERDSQRKNLEVMMRELERDTSSRVSDVCRTKILPKDVLNREISGLQDRLSSANDSLMERNLILTELTKVSDDLRRATSDWRHSSYSSSSSSQLNGIHAQLRRAVRSGRSLCAESSFWEGRVQNLEEVNTGLTKYERELAECLKNGTVPSSIVDKFVRECVRKNVPCGSPRSDASSARRRLLPEGVGRMSTGFGSDTGGGGENVFTTAPLRPNCYIPVSDESMGVPRPYPGFAPPVLPTKCGVHLQRIARSPSSKRMVVL